MSNTTPGATAGDSERRSDKPPGRPVLAGVQVRHEDIEPTTGIHWVAILFRVMSILVTLLAIMQVVLGLTGSVPISYGVLIADAVRLLIGAGLLFAAGDLADLYVKSHYDQRALKILVARLEYRFRNPPPAAGPARPEEADRQQ